LQVLAAGAVVGAEFKYRRTRIASRWNRSMLTSRTQRGWGSAGEGFVALPEAMRRLIRDEVRNDVGDRGGPIEIEVELGFASGRK
jgi:hypothetical protein